MGIAAATKMWSSVPTVLRVPDGATELALPPGKTNFVLASTAFIAGITNLRGPYSPNQSGQYMQGFTVRFRGGDASLMSTGVTFVNDNSPSFSEMDLGGSNAVVLNDSSLILELQSDGSWLRIDNESN